MGKSDRVLTVRRLIAALAALVLVAAACDSGGEPEPDPTLERVVPTTTTTLATTTSTTAAPDATFPPPPSAEPVDRLLVLDPSGNVVTMDPDGGNVTELTSDAGNTAGYFQPTWSPTAEAVAVTRFHAAGFSLVRFDVASGNTTEVPTENNAFYLYWSPAGDRLGYLSTGAVSLALRLVEFGEEATESEIDVGQPFYFAWSPDGQQLATLIAEDRFELRAAAAGAAKSEIASPGAFQNPIWTEAGLIFVTSINGTDQLVVGSPDGEFEVLAGSPAPAIITAPRSGERIAVQARGDGDGVAASFQEAPLLPLNRLVVIDTATGEMSQVGDEIVLAYFWDPTGSRLLVLDDNTASGRLRWSVWEEGELKRLAEFLPARNFIETFLPFFGQYALSTTMWAPDGSAFAFAGLVADRGGIYVQDVAGGDPVFVADGNWVTWSPR